MDKISGIIPSSPRLASVDMKEASPVRPGTPSFGRPEGVSSLRPIPQTSITNTTADRGSGIQKEMMDWRSKEQRQAKIAEDLSNKFFIRNQKEAEPVVDIDEPIARMPIAEAAVQSMPTGFKRDEFGFMASEIEDEPVESMQPEGLYPKGSFLDRTV